MKKKPCNCHKEQETAFLAYQSGNRDPKIMDLVFECVGELTVKLKDNNIRLYTVIQSGTPPAGCGGPGQPKCDPH